MTLTGEELADIDKLLARMEKNARAWRFCRWFLIGAGLLLVGMALWVLTLAESCWKTPILTEPGHNVTGADLLFERLTAMGFCVLYVIAIFQGFFGVCVVLSILLRWNKGRRDALLIKLARSYIEAQR